MPMRVNLQGRTSPAIINGAIIGSIQTISDKVRDNAEDMNTTITSVDMNRTMIIRTGWKPQFTAPPKHYCFLHQLTSSTNIFTDRIERRDPDGGIFFDLLVIEYASGIASIQRGTSTTGDVTINEVDLNKTIINYLGQKYNSTDWASGKGNRHWLRLTTSTNLSVFADGTLSYEVIEFE